MSVSNDFLNYVLEQLSSLRGLRPKRMFGAVGVYCEENFFAVIDDDILYLKTDDSTRGEYEARGMRRFMPMPDKQGSMAYHEVPADVLEDRDELAIWARKSVAVATAVTARKQAKQARAKALSARGKSRPPTTQTKARTKKKRPAAARRTGDRSAK
jgi:DNA transformation protein and related proteins